ncbi:hypothetical protein BBO01nite_13450 [Brevibacillus borstelensis]|nr:hypothetical protein BBO01nite_13450 [Brevibacillus borstelensis]
MKPPLLGAAVDVFFTGVVEFVVLLFVVAFTLESALFGVVFVGAIDFLPDL